MYTMAAHGSSAAMAVSPPPSSSRATNMIGTVLLTSCALGLSMAVYFASRYRSSDTDEARAGRTSSAAGWQSSASTPHPPRTPAPAPVSSVSSAPAPDYYDICAARHVRRLNANTMEWFDPILRLSIPFSPILFAVRREQRQSPLILLTLSYLRQEEHRISVAIEHTATALSAESYREASLLQIASCAQLLDGQTPSKAAASFMLPSMLVPQAEYCYIDEASNRLVYALSIFLTHKSLALTVQYVAPTRVRNIVPTAFYELVRAIRLDGSVTSAAVQQRRPPPLLHLQSRSPSAAHVPCAPVPLTPCLPSSFAYAAATSSYLLVCEPRFGVGFRLPLHFRVSGAGDGATAAAASHCPGGGTFTRHDSNGYDSGRRHRSVAAARVYAAATSVGTERVGVWACYEPSAPAHGGSHTATEKKRHGGSRRAHRRSRHRRTAAAPPAHDVGRNGGGNAFGWDSDPRRAGAYREYAEDDGNGAAAESVAQERADYMAERVRWAMRWMGVRHRRRGRCVRVVVRGEDSPPRSVREDADDGDDGEEDKNMLVFRRLVAPCCARGNFALDEEEEDENGKSEGHEAVRRATTTMLHGSCAAQQTRHAALSAAAAAASSPARPRLVAYLATTRVLVQRHRTSRDYAGSRGDDEDDDDGGGGGAAFCWKALREADDWVSSTRSFYGAPTRRHTPMMSRDGEAGNTPYMSQKNSTEEEEEEEEPGDIAAYYAVIMIPVDGDAERQWISIHLVASELRSSLTDLLARCRGVVRSVSWGNHMGQSTAVVYCNRRHDVLPFCLTLPLRGVAVWEPVLGDPLAVLVDTTRVIVLRACALTTHPPHRWHAPAGEDAAWASRRTRHARAWLPNKPRHGRAAVRDALQRLIRHAAGATTTVMWPVPNAHRLTLDSMPAVVMALHEGSNENSTAHTSRMSDGNRSSSSRLSHATGSFQQSSSSCLSWSYSSRGSESTTTTTTATATSSSSSSSSAALATTANAAEEEQRQQRMLGNVLSYPDPYTISDRVETAQGSYGLYLVDRVCTASATTRCGEEAAAKSNKDLSSASRVAALGPPMPPLLSSHKDALRLVVGSEDPSSSASRSSAALSASDEVTVSFFANRRRAAMQRDGVDAPCRVVLGTGGEGYAFLFMTTASLRECGAAAEALVELGSHFHRLSRVT